MSILVTGSTGVVGSQVLSHLAASVADQAVDIRALTRSPDRASFPSGVRAVRGDLADLDSVRDALRDVRTLFLLVPNAADELTQAMLTVDAARDAGVRGIVYLSVFMGDRYADVPHFASKFTIERMIEASGLPATVLRPAYFIQNDARMKDALLGAGIYGMPVGARGISMVDVRDIGDAAARSLLRRHGADGPLPHEVIALVGPAAMDGETLATTWSAALGRPVRYGGDDLDALEQRLRALSPGWLARDLRLMMGRYQDTGAVATPAEIERFTALLGRPPRSYAAFAHDAAAEWSKNEANGDSAESQA